MEFAAAIGMATTGCITQLRVVRPIVLQGSGVTCQLDSNDGWRSFERAGNGPHADTSLSHARNRNAVLRLELLVSRLFLHVHTLQDRVLHFTFEAAYFYQKTFAYLLSFSEIVMGDFAVFRDMHGRRE